MVEDGSIYVRQPPRLAYQRRTSRIKKVQDMLAKSHIKTEFFLKAVINCDVFKYEALKVAENGPEESDDDDSIFDESLEALSSDDEVLPPTQRCFCICMMEEVTRAFLPCGHLVIGEACVDQYRLTSNLCPVCRSEYTTIQRMYFN